jgi:hypothetical protein
MYCLLAYIPTTYFAFIQAPFLTWMPAFARLQPYLFTVTFCGAAIPLWQHFRSGHDRWLILEFWFIGVLGSACLMWMRPVQSLGNNSLSFVWAVAFLLPVICLGALDYAGYLGKLKEQREGARSFSYVRVIAAALLVSVLYPGSAFLRFYIARMPSPLTRNELAICIWAAITQVLLFLFVASVVDLARRAADRSAQQEARRFLLYTGLWWLGLAFALFKVVLASIPFAETEGTLYACFLSLAAVIFIGGRRLRRRVQRNHAAAAVEQQPDKQRANGYESAALFLLIFAAALIVPLLIGSMDWHSILEKTWAMALWVMAAALVVYQQPLTRGRLRTWHIILVAFMSLAVFRAGLWSQKSWAVVLSEPNADAGTAVRQHETFDASFAAANEIMTPPARIHAIKTASLFRIKPISRHRLAWTFMMSRWFTICSPTTAANPTSSSSWSIPFAGITSRPTIPALTLRPLSTHLRKMALCFATPLLVTAVQRFQSLPSGRECSCCISIMCSRFIWSTIWKK